VLSNIYDEYLTCITQLGGALFIAEKGDNKFSSQTVGVSKLSTIIKTMCSKARIERYFTNHSGKRTCATSLYEAGVPEQEIMNRTGHRSVESVRKYKRGSTEMLMDIANILEPGSSKRIKTEKSEFPKCERSDDLKENNTEICNESGRCIFTGCYFNFA
jgi:integrase